MSEGISPEKIKLFKRRNVKTLYKIKEKDKSCPKCLKKLQKFNYTYDSNIFLDRCNDCGGIWADGGEVLAIASHLKDDPDASAIARYFAESMAQPERELTDLLAGYFLFFPRFVVPIYDDTPRERFPFVTISLIAVCVLTFLCQIFLVADVEGFFARFGLIPANLFSIGLITSMFLHAGIFHLIFNMLFLWLFGDNVEDRFTRLGYLLFCLCCGFFAGFLHSIFNLDSTIPAVGASGMISGIMGAYLIFYPEANVTVWCFYKTYEVPVVLYLVGWFVIQLTYAFLSRNGDTIGVAWFAHIGGFVLGVVVGFCKKIAKKQ